MEFTLGIAIDCIIQKKFSKVRNDQNSVLQIRLLIYLPIIAIEFELLDFVFRWKRDKGSNVE